MNSKRDLYDDLASEQRLSSFLLATVRYIPLLTSLLGLGLLGLFALSRANLLGQPAWQVAVAAGTSVAIGLLHLLINRLARGRRGHLALSLFWVLLGIWSLSIVLLWDSVAFVAIFMAWVAFLVALIAGVRGRWLVGMGAASAVLSAVIGWIGLHPLFDRLGTANPAGLAAIILVSSTVLLFVLGTIVVRLFKYRSLQSRLVVTFALILAVPVLFTTAISATTAYTNSREQFAASIQAVTSLKRDQINSTVGGILVQTSTLQQGSERAASVLHVLSPAGQEDASYRLNVSAARTLMRDVMAQYPSSRYEEILVLDASGHAVLSTYNLDEGTDFSNQAFFRQGSKAFYSQIMDFPSKQNLGRSYKLVVAVPFYGENSQDVRGVVVAVLNSDPLLSLMGATAGISNAQTYLVGEDSRLIGATATNAPAVTAWPIVHMILGRQGEGSEVYINHEGRSVLGYSAWLPSINAALVTEIPESDVVNKAISSLLVSGLVGLFAIIIAIIAALSSSQAISEPIQELATAAKSLATGNLSARATTDQRDEVGNLANSFNAMAGQLEGMITTLEQRVAERTQALEQQSLRLRTAAEVARDAASAPSLDALLDQAARLIRDRFSLYHTGIFLLDEKREFAVLRASPSEAGKKMLENQHRLRVGEQGIVGRVAATGEPRIALDTGVDPVHFFNPLLPNTHSEMALPLKTAEGTLGVIDIQSDQPEAFTQDDIAIVQVMADQLATAIQRTNLLQQVQTQLAQLEQSYQSFTEQSWRTFGRAGRQNIGYKFDNVRLESIKTVPEDVRNLFDKGEALPAGLNGHNLQIPIRLRGQVIGAVQLRFQTGNAPEVTTAMIQQIADRLATALENARLLEDSLRRANKERAIGEITTKISASVNMRNVLQTAVEELGRAIPGSDVMIQFRPDTEI